MADESVENTGKIATPADDSSKQDASGKALMHVKIYSPFKVYFDEKAYSISGLNATGPFDILPRHHNFITLLGTCDLTIRALDKEPKIHITGGLMHVKADEVTVFLDV